MANSEKMPQVDMAKEFGKLSEVDQHFVKKMEKMNLNRAQTMKSMRNRNLWVGGLLATGVISIYVYSMVAVKQEKFLDFVDEPTDQK